MPPARLCHRPGPPPIPTSPNPAIPELVGTHPDLDRARSSPTAMPLPGSLNPLPARSSSAHMPFLPLMNPSRRPKVSLPSALLQPLPTHHPHLRCRGLAPSASPRACSTALDSWIEDLLLPLWSELDEEGEDTRRRSLACGGPGQCREWVGRE
jgi:hypothetical protein